MKKIGFAHRGLAFLLALVMVLQMVPVVSSRAAVNDIASGEYAGDMGIDPSTLNQEGSINWPVKIFDYLNDGMLFEYSNVLSQTISNSTTSEVAGGAGYGGGEKVPVTTLGTDYTHPAAYLENAYLNHAAHSRGTAYTLTPKAAVAFQTPRYLQVTAGTGTNKNIEVANFYEDNDETYAPSDIRYMTIVYRASGLSNDKFSLLIQNSSGSYPRGVEMSAIGDSSTWVYRVIDLKSALGTTLYNSTTGIRGVWVTVDGLSGSDKLDISHVAFFDTAIEASNYGKDAAAFSNNPGEDLSVSVTTGGTTMPTVAKPDYLFALRQYYKTSGATSGTTIESAGNYGLDFTTTSTSNGYYSTGYNSETYSTWSKNTSLALPYGSVSDTTSYTMSAMTVSRKTETNGASYVRLTNSSSSMFLLSEFREELGESSAPKTSDVNYMVMVLRGNNMSSNRMAFWAQGHNGSQYFYAGVSSASGWMSSAYTKSVYFNETSGTWTYIVVPLTETISTNDSDMNSITYLKRLGIYLPALSGSASLDIAYVAYFNTSAKASTFGNNAAAYMNSGKTTGGATLSNRGWNAGNNQNFGMLYASCGGNWGTFDAYGNRYYTTAGGNNPDPNGYYSWMIGYHTAYGPTDVQNAYRQDIYGNSYTAKHTSSSGVVQSSVTGNGSAGSTNYSNHIYFIYPGWSDDGISGNVEKDIFDTSVLTFDGYTLQEKATSGLFTAGLLEGTLSEDRLPVYRQETVEYIAMTLYNALPIPQKDANGNYNYNFITGGKSSQYGGVDLNGDGSIGMADLNGDGYKETNEAKPDLATALRQCLGIKFTAGLDRGTTPELGSYSATATKADSLKGEFANCRSSITTCMDAAYYLLNNIFVDNSYNQLQDDYGYMTLSGATLDEGGFAYIFDAGFTTGKQGQETTSGYKESSESALVYSPYELVNADGTVTHGSGTISLGNVNSKDLYYYEGNNATTRFPFLPVTDGEGDYAGPSTSYYFCDDGIRSCEGEYGTYQGRNFNYVLASNGEFVYREEDKLFFEFEGDDDVYLFINGQIVLDIGGGHSITSVGISVDDYVQSARKALAELEKYGYTAEMSNADFDKMIDGAKLTQYTFDSEGNITSQKTVNNPYSEAQKTLFKRHHRLNLLEGEICQFDFYYMERHGNGANMRIVTNMHVTDPTLTVEKTAYQYEDDIEYGGVVDAASPVEYNFKLTNTGNTKLYNLTFSDEVIGVNLDRANGLTVTDGMNGLYVLDKDGGPLDASDVYAIVRGTNSKGVYSETEVHFEDQEELQNFLYCLDGEGLESGMDDAEITNAGSGLWVNASVEIKGIYYILTPEQVEEGLIHNTVYVTATTRTDPNASGSETLRSDASHRAYTSGAPVYYQWAEHELFLKVKKLLDDATQEAGVEDSLLNQYYAFFNKVGGDTSKIYSRLSDKYGRAMTYDEISDFTDGAGNDGFSVNYTTTGTHNFYILMFLNENNKGYTQDTVVDNMVLGNYAVIRVTVYTADVEDSYYVLDYGLKTESLDVGGQLFEQDYLFGNSGGMEAKLMGVTITRPSYLSAAEMKVKGMTHVDYNRIGFESADLTQNKKLTPYAADSDPDGYFNVNVPIPSLGKAITYDSYTGQYSLTGAGTVTVNAEVPTDGNWNKVCLYYWYDNGTNNGWPGTPMTTNGGGKFKLDIPGDVTHIIINNGSTALQTQNLSITAGVESTVKISYADNKVSATVSSVIAAVTTHVSIPDNWGTPYLYYKFDDGTSDVAWPGIELTEKDENGNYVTEIPGSASYVVVNNGVGNLKQTAELDINAGQELWLVVNTEPKGQPDDSGVSFYNADIIYSQDLYTVKAQVPSSWGSDVYLYYWYTGSTSTPVDWPGVKMVKKDGWYTVDISEGISNLVITNGTSQTVDLTVHAGLETQIVVSDEKLEVNGDWKHTATVSYGSDSVDTGLTFTPTKFIDNEQSLWLAITVHTTGKRPTALGAAPMNNTEGFTTAAEYGTNINNEVQMYKKVTILPANVVYYEDDFKGITYNYFGSSNSFVHHGDGSVVVNQDVDQDRPYGQSPTYQSNDNSQYSGSSMTAVLVRSTDKVASFTFKGTGFELISRTNATNSASFVVKIYDADTYAFGGEPERVMPVVTQFDNGNDGGSEEIGQVPAFRVNDLALGKYVVEVYGSPTYDFTNWDGVSVPSMIPTYLYIDGLRIFQPMGATHSAYLDSENGAQFNEIRDLVNDGMVGVADVNGTNLTVSAGTTTWTEDLKSENASGFAGNQVDSTDDYLVQGPNNEVYMAGGSSNSALVLYVSENSAMYSYELQVAIRALDYGKFVGEADTGVYAQLQLGIKTSSGYGWQNIATVVSGTEQYYSIPYTLCPKDAEGRYQVVLRLVSESKSGQTVLASYSSFKTVGMKFHNMEGVGEATILYYVDGLLVSPSYYLYGELNGITVGSDTTDTTYLFNGHNKLDFTASKDSKLAIKRDMAGNTQLYMVNGSDVSDTSAVMYDTTTISGTKGYMTIPAGHTFTLKITQSDNNSLTLSYELKHSWDEGKVTTAATCTTDGEILYTCTKCQTTRTEVIPATGHNYENGQCTICGEVDPDSVPRVIYFRNTAGWETPYIYTWTTGVGELTGAWPGSAMNRLGSTDLYFYTVPAGTQMCIFTNNSGAQTGDLQLLPDADLFIYADNRWITYDKDCSHSSHSQNQYCDGCGILVEHTFANGACSICGKSDPSFVGYYLVGYINGADYGCEDDWENLGEYKFVDGKLVATFEQDSYIFIKTGDNVNWYLTNTYTTDTTATFYLNSSEKMFVPGGKEITFTLTVNGDNTLTLSYTAKDVAEEGYVRVDSVNDITAGGSYVLVAPVEGGFKALGTTLSSGKLAAVDVTVSNNRVTGADLPVWTIEPVSGGVALSLDGSYLKYSSSTNFTMADEAYIWTVTAGDSGYVFDNSIGTRGIYYQISGDRYGAYAVSNADNSGYVSQLLVFKYEAVASALDLYSIQQQMMSSMVVNETTAPLAAPTLKLDHPSLSFEDAISYNIYYSVSDMTNVAELGLITFDSKLTGGTIANAKEIIPGYTGDGALFVSSTNGIPAKNMGDTVYFKVYAKLTDGSYVYSSVAGYNAVAYANTVLNGNNEAAKALVVAMLNYGAAAQEYFGYNTDNLMNAGLTSEQVYDEGMIADVVKADSAKLGAFTATAGAFTDAYPKVSFEGAFAINYYFTPAKAVDDGMTLYYWDAATYEAASELTAENATGVIRMTAGNGYSASVAGIAAKQIDETVYVAGVYTSDGQTYCTGVIAYSLGRYLETVAADSASGAQDLAKAAAIYGTSAKDYFA